MQAIEAAKKKAIEYSNSSFTQVNSKDKKKFAGNINGQLNQRWLSQKETRIERGESWSTQQAAEANN